jgi:cytosine deaminase
MSEGAAEFAPAKVNLTLHVGRARGDGYHPLASLVVFADWGDTLTAEPAGSLTLTLTGPGGADQRALLNTAIEAGADLVGGVPHLEGDNDREATETLLQIATDHGVGVDLHTDETLDADVLGLVHLAELTSSGFEHPVTASHCVSLGMQPASRQRQVAELVAEAGISVIALPHTNLFLQGRGYAPMPRGLTAVAALTDAGVNVAAGADNLQDPFNPVGRACPFETAGLMIMSAHLLPHDAWRSVSQRSAIATGREPLEIAPGNRAHLLAARADTVRQAIASGPADRIVWRNGLRVPT